MFYGDVARKSGSLPISAPGVLTASHQFPTGVGDARAGLIEIIVREIARTNVGLRIAMDSDTSICSPSQQWDALVSGELDISTLPLDCASKRHPQFSATRMPGLVRSHERAQRLSRSPFMRDIKAIIEAAGVVVLADAWLSGALASKQGCICGPGAVRGLKVRAAGPAFKQMLAAAGAVSVSMPSSGICEALRGGRLDAAVTSLESFSSFRLFKQAKYLIVPGHNALCFTYEPVLMSRLAFERLSDVQRHTLLAAGRRAQALFESETPHRNHKMIAAFRQAGVQVTEMARNDYYAWLAIARRSAYASFACNVPGGDELIGKALSVD